MRYVLIAVLMVGLTVPALQAQPMMQRGKEIKEKLNLTDDQTAALKEIRMKTAKQMIDVGSAIKKKGIDLKSLMSEENPDRNAVKSLMTDIGNLKIERNMLMFDTRQATSKVLTPEQQKIMKEMRSSRKEHIKGKMKQRMHNRGPGMRGDMMGDEPEGPPMGFSPDEDMPEGEF